MTFDFGSAGRSQEEAEGERTERPQCQNQNISIDLFSTCGLCIKNLATGGLSSPVLQFSVQRAVAIAFSTFYLGTMQHHVRGVMARPEVHLGWGEQRDNFFLTSGHGVSWLGSHQSLCTVHASSNSAAEKARTDNPAGLCNCPCSHSRRVFPHALVGPAQGLG